MQVRWFIVERFGADGLAAHVGSAAPPPRCPAPPPLDRQPHAAHTSYRGSIKYIQGLEKCDDIL